MYWCLPTTSETVKCGRWLCMCGHLALTHTIYDENCYNYCDVGYCKCAKFMFRHNNNCTLECQFFRKVYEQDTI